MALNRSWKRLIRIEGFPLKPTGLPPLFGICLKEWNMV